MKCSKNFAARTACMLLLLPWSIVSSGSSGTGSISIELEKTVVSQGEPVLATIRVENKGSEELELDLGGDSKGNLVVLVTGPEGVRHEGKLPQSKGRTVFLGNVHLGTGERYFQTIVLSEWFSFSSIGQYQIEVRVTSPLKAGGRATPVEPFSLALGVTSQDPRQLLMSCENLLSRIQAEGSAQDSLASVIALSLVHDPVVAPLWGRLLTSPAFGETAATRLAQMEDSEAVEVLATALRSPNAAARSLAEGALRLISSQTADPSVKAGALNALNR